VVAAGAPVDGPAMWIRGGLVALTGIWFLSILNGLRSRG
jgi:hypothetical protein